MLSTDIPPGIADTLGYLQHHLQELTECQNASEHAINTTLVALTAQLQQITQLMTSPTPTLTPTVAPLPIPMSSPPVSPSSPVPATLPKQQARPMSQTSFGYISINYLTILTVLMAMENP